jgi:HSP20 family protein
VAVPNSKGRVQEEMEFESLLRLAALSEGLRALRCKSKPNENEAARPKEAVNMATPAVQKEKEGIVIKTTTPEAFLDQIQEAFDAISRRAFGIFEGNGRMFGRDLDNWFQAEKEMFHPVHLDINESDESISVKAEVPGFSEKELQVTVEPNRLTVSGKRESTREEKKGKSIYSETCSNEVFRVVDLPVEVDTEKVTATLKDGVLQLTMPKAAKARTVQIQPEAT